MDTREYTHPDDTLEAQYSGLERPCCCLDGWAFVGYVDEYGEERQASYRCRRCRGRDRGREQGGSGERR